jgi:diguanylate cyclase (GGDEF)-like protein
VRLTDKFKVWAQGCRDNFLHKHVLLSAELTRVDGQLEQAMELYGQAIEAARQAGFCVCEALANELYARFWIARKQKQLATGFIRDAYYYYEAWGAKVKCLALEREWPTITFRIGEKKQATSERTRSHRKVSEQSELLDLQSLLKANQLLAEEIHLESLLRKMMGVLLENAGAEQGAIILVDGDELVVEVMGKMVKGLQIGYTRVDKPLAEVCDSDYPLLPDAIIRHVQRSHETLLLNCPADDERFSRSRYLENQQPKSVLCLPILSQGKLVALVYLENNLLENAFTVRQKKTLELLSSQMAISLVNAHLYDNLEEKVLQRTEQLRQMSMRDGLTGIANRRCFDERLDSEWRRCVRHGQPMSLLMVDIDHFKEYNDHYGHVDGDACIKAVASALAHSANRAGDFVARYGGEEFAILLSETDGEVAEQVAQACLKAVAQLQRPHHTSQCSNVVSISLGVCCVVASQYMTAEQLVKQADQALYQAKQGGRNRYNVFAPPAVL